MNIECFYLLKLIQFALILTSSPVRTSPQSPLINEKIILPRFTRAVPSPGTWQRFYYFYTPPALKIKIRSSNQIFCGHKVKYLNTDHLKSFDLNIDY